MTDKDDAKLKKEEEERKRKEKELDKALVAELQELGIVGQPMAPADEIGTMINDLGSYTKPQLQAKSATQYYKVKQLESKLKVILDALKKGNLNSENIKEILDQATMPAPSTQTPPEGQSSDSAKEVREMMKEIKPILVMRELLGGQQSAPSTPAISPELVNALRDKEAIIRIKDEKGEVTEMPVTTFLMSKAQNPSGLEERLKRLMPEDASATKEMMDMIKPILMIKMLTHNEQPAQPLISNELLALLRPQEKTVRITDKEGHTTEVPLESYLQMQQGQGIGHEEVEEIVRKYAPQPQEQPSLKDQVEVWKSLREVLQGEVPEVAKVKESEATKRLEITSDKDVELAKLEAKQRQAQATEKLINMAMGISPEETERPQGQRQPQQQQQAQGQQQSQGQAPEKHQQGSMEAKISEEFMKKALS